MAKNPAGLKLYVFVINIQIEFLKLNFFCDNTLAIILIVFINMAQDW